MCVCNVDTIVHVWCVHVSCMCDNAFHYSANTITLDDRNHFHTCKHIPLYIIYIHTYMITIATITFIVAWTLQLWLFVQYTQLNTQHTHGCIRLQLQYYTLSVTPGIIVQWICPIRLDYVWPYIKMDWKWPMSCCGRLLFWGLKNSSKKQQYVDWVILCIQIICIYILSTIFCIFPQKWVLANEKLLQILMAWAVNLMLWPCVSVVL